MTDNIYAKIVSNVHVGLNDIPAGATFILLWPFLIILINTSASCWRPSEYKQTVHFR